MLDLKSEVGEINKSCIYCWKWKRGQIDLIDLNKSVIQILIFERSPEKVVTKVKNRLIFKKWGSNLKKGTLIKNSRAIFMVWSLLLLSEIKIKRSLLLRPRLTFEDFEGHFLLSWWWFFKCWWGFFRYQGYFSTKTLTFYFLVTLVNRTFSRLLFKI